MSLKSLSQVEPKGEWSNQMGSHAWQFLFQSSPTNPEAVRVGVWKWSKMDDTDKNEIITSKYDEVKYIISGSMVVQDVKSGHVHELKAGSVLWIEKDSQSKVLDVKDLLVLYVDPNPKDSTSNSEDDSNAPALS